MKESTRLGWRQPHTHKFCVMVAQLIYGPNDSLITEQVRKYFELRVTSHTLQSGTRLYKDVADFTSDMPNASLYSATCLTSRIVYRNIVIQRECAISAESSRSLVWREGSRVEPNLHWDCKTGLVFLPQGQTAFIVQALEELRYFLMTLRRDLFCLTAIK